MSLSVMSIMGVSAVCRQPTVTGLTDIIAHTAVNIRDYSHNVMEGRWTGKERRGE